MTNQSKRIGELPPKYTFILNPYADYRFTRCPHCDEKTKLRKWPFFVFVAPHYPVVINMTGRYCPDCDLMIVHQDELEELLTGVFSEVAPNVIGNDYSVMGTVEPSAWHEGKKQPKSIPEILEHLHDFKDVETVRVQPAGWYPADMDDSERPFEEPAPLDTLWQERSPSSDRREASGKGSESSESKPRKRRHRRRK